MSERPAPERLETERLWLRPWRDADLDDYAPICADPVVRERLAGVPLSRAEAWLEMARLAGHWVLRGFGFWAVEEKASGRLIGRVGFNQPEGWPGFEIGWTLARPCWGRGLATEAAREALRCAFEEMGREHVISVIEPRNTTSIAVAERIGERYERPVRVKGLDVSIYGIDRERWRKLSAEER